MYYPDHSFNYGTLQLMRADLHEIVGLLRLDRASDALNTLQRAVERQQDSFLEEAFATARYSMPAEYLVGGMA